MLSLLWCENSNREDLTREIVLNDRYHHKIAKLRQDMLKVSGITKKERIMVYLWSLSFPSEWHRLLDLIMSFPPDPAHSEYYGLVRRLYSVHNWKKHSHNKRHFNNSTPHFFRFSFPAEWGRIQSPATHGFMDFSRMSPKKLRTWDTEP